ncbi:MAG TPA: CPBP family intramembrane glutamic endopeptidase [Pyrinomonadaceae bacterium]|jgi:membrane protease YdiL (CAAX protease family)|nr:CPBP family intramembrane glutamic endopeptidase [Pyrinomonadaceae bacterium]
MLPEDKSYDAVIAGTSGDAALAAWEIVSVTTSFLIAAWLILPFAGNDKLVWAFPVALAFALMFASHRIRGETRLEIGWRADNFFRAVRLLLIPTLGLAILIILLGWLAGSLRFEGSQLRPRFLWLPAWALMQQYVMQGFINRRAQLIWGRGWPSILLVGFIFALLHLPNLWLSLATLIGGTICAYVYQRVPNLFALALSHGLISVLLVSALPTTALRSMRVGFKFFE